VFFCHSLVYEGICAVSLEDLRFLAVTEEVCAEGLQLGICAYLIQLGIGILCNAVGIYLG
jgi:hypothetical protein